MLTQSIPRVKGYPSPGSARPTTFGFGGEIRPSARDARGGRRSSLALLGGRSLHTDALVRTVRTDHRDLGVVDSPDAHVSVLTSGGRVRPADDLVLAGLVDDAIAELEVHRQDPARRWCCVGGLLLWLRLRHRRASAHRAPRLGPPAKASAPTRCRLRSSTSAPSPLCRRWLANPSRHTG